MAGAARCVAERRYTQSIAPGRCGVDSDALTPLASVVRRAAQKVRLVKRRNSLMVPRGSEIGRRQPVRNGGTLRRVPCRNGSKPKA